MNILDWLQAYSGLLSFISSIILVVVTGIYVYFTKKIMDTSIRQSNLVSNPVVGIKLGNMGISTVFGPSRRNMDIGLNLTNVGNAPAIEVLVDAEIEYQYTNINGEKIIPARFEPSSIPFIRPGEEVLEENQHNPTFGNTCIAHLFDDKRENSRLNIHRIENNPRKYPYPHSILRVYIYYRNNLGQYFESTYETQFDVGNSIRKAGEPLDFIPPADDETCELRQIFIPRPIFHSGPIKKEKMEKEIIHRDSKRNLCGW
ncbi:hypothetical protein [Methanobacterium paludis]|uniref:Uncharacterized protein n=1 Tax=Methanobacterium paludis (strain DSM 25820 / JCM 18151 / SWAN1) TaxID=868131 RepID=F6D666_METPW|nr:hypothetical protein [Methanobacterium paludis]AEG18279.1 hypothetical protein MSWAN_1262 [Methanobacterium paludis]